MADTDVAGAGDTATVHLAGAVGEKSDGEAITVRPACGRRVGAERTFSRRRSNIRVRSREANGTAVNSLFHLLSSPTLNRTMLG